MERGSPGKETETIKGRVNEEGRKSKNNEKRKWIKKRMKGRRQK